MHRGPKTWPYSKVLTLMHQSKVIINRIFHMVNSLNSLFKEKTQATINTSVGTHTKWNLYV